MSGAVGSTVGTGAAHLLLILVVGVPVFTLWVLVLCIRTKMRRKILWSILILLGATTLTLNWTTGEMDFQLFSLHLPSARYYKAGIYAPWIFSVSFPLGAVMFLIKRRFEARAREEDAELAAMNDAAASDIAAAVHPDLPRE